MHRLRASDLMLVELGRLVRIEWRGVKRATRHQAWSMRSAPVLAYDPDKRKASLLIVYGARPIGPSSLRARAEYGKTHWGKLGRMKDSEGVALAGKLLVLGPCLRVIYATRKGSDELVDFDHVFGKGAKGAWTPPSVCTSQDAGVPRGTLQLAGGTYCVTAHGIVG